VKLISLLFVIATIVYSAIYYSVTYDDLFAIGSIKALGFSDALKFYYQKVNGRWASHFLMLGTFKIIGHRIQFYFIPVIFYNLFFFLSLNTFLNAILKLNKHKITHGLYAYSILILLSFTNRFENFIWLNSIPMHLTGLSFLLLLGSQIVTHNKNHFILLALSFVAGGFNEVFCLVFVVLLSVILAYKKIPVSVFLIVIMGITVSLLINILSSGFTTRLNLLPSFQLIQSIKNTLHSLLLILFSSRMATLISFTALLLIASEGYFRNTQWIEKIKQNKIIIGISVMLIIINTFMTCYILSDIAPARAQLLNLLVLTITIITIRFSYKEN
jgi:hypothetical protein